LPQTLEVSLEIKIRRHFGLSRDLNKGKTDMPVPASRPLEDPSGIFSMGKETRPVIQRRQFIKTLGTSLAVAASPAPLYANGRSLRKQAKITDVKAIMVKGPTADWPLVKIETDAGVTGFGESYWGRGIKEIILGYLREAVLGEDPLDIDRLYTKMIRCTGGAGAIAGVTVTAISGVEIALWDLAGKLLGVPVCKLLGGQYRQQVRAYSTRSPRNIIDPASCREFADELRSDPRGFTAVKTDIVRKLTQREPHSRQLSNRELADNARGFANLREALGEDIDIAVHCHWELDWIDALNLARAVAPIKPIWLEDPLPPDFAETWVKLTEQSPVPILTGENLYTRHGFKPFILQQGCHLIHIDIPKAGGLLESRKIADLADTFYMPVCAHSASSPLGFMASAHCAASIRNFRALEHSVGRFGEAWEKFVIHREPLIKEGHIQIPAKPGLGVDLNEDEVRAHLFPGEQWWG
jgi:L-alanine-DL-glutamate epimerase-like enolase superfamily enzyme